MKKYKYLKGKSGIYKILNTVNEKTYVGSAVCIYSRICTHIKNLKKGNHKNSILQRHHDKYGECFYFEVLEFCEIQSLIEKEQYYLDSTNCNKNKGGFNILEKAGSVFGFRHSNETKSNWSKNRKGVKFSDEAKYNMSQSKQGSNHNKAKLTDSNVLDIRKVHDGSRGASKILAEKYKVSWSTIHYIIIRKTWKHI